MTDLDDRPERPSPDHFWGARSQRWFPPLPGFTAREWMPPYTLGIRNRYDGSPEHVGGGGDQAPNYFVKQEALAFDVVALEAPEADG